MKKIANELKKIAKELEAAGGLNRDMERAFKDFNEFGSNLSSLYNLIAYRFDKDGSKDINGKPILDEYQQKTTKEVLGELRKLITKVEGMSLSVKEMKKKIKKIDPWIKMS